MKDQKIRQNLNFKTIFLTFFGVGYTPFAPGTWGSLATIPLLYLLAHFNIPFLTVISATFVLLLVASLIADRVEQEMDIHDPSWIVFDEVLGMITTWLFSPSESLTDLITIFVLFRIFDILKPWPVSTIDKKINNGLGTMLDDIMAGLYAGTSYWLVKNFLLVAQ